MDAGWSPRPFVTITHEVQKRSQHYTDDWAVGFRHPAKILASTVYMFFVSIFPALTFGDYLSATTTQYGVVETLLSTALCGVTFALFSGQPLVIVGVTGPITIFCSVVHDICRQLNLRFLPVMFWVGIWSAAMCISLGVFNCCEILVNKVTRFSCEIFGVLVAVIYVINAGKAVVHQFEIAGLAKIDTALLSLFLASFTAVLALRLSASNSWWLLTRAMRALVSDYALAAAIIAGWVLANIPPFFHVNLPELKVPKGFMPSASDRKSWLVEFWDIPAWGAFFSILPAIILTILVFFDHNVSSLLAQRPEHGLVKGSAYNYDFVVVGVSMVLCAFLGLPIAHGLIPQAELHVKSLIQPAAAAMSYMAEEEAQDVSRNGKNGGRRVVETRLTGLLQSVLIGLTLSPPPLRLLRTLPPAVLAGSFVFMGISSLLGNQFYARLVALFLAEPGHRPRHYQAAGLPPEVAGIPYSRLAWFTGIQLLFLAAIGALTESGSAAAISFPIFIMALVPLRYVLFPRYFTAQELAMLDSWGDETDATSHTTDGSLPTSAGDVEMARTSMERMERAASMPRAPSQGHVPRMQPEDSATELLRPSASTADSAPSMRPEITANVDALAMRQGEAARVEALSRRARRLSAERAAA